MSNLPWLGMDKSDNDLELLLAAKRHKESEKAKVQNERMHFTILQKLKIVLIGETVQNLKATGLSSGEALKMSFSTMRQQNILICLLTLSGLLMQICEVEILYSKNREADAVTDVMKSFVLIASILSVIFLSFWYRLLYAHKKFTNSILPGERFISTELAYYYAIEFLILIFHSPPGLTVIIDSSLVDEKSKLSRATKYTGDELLLCIMFLRFYVLIRALLHSSGLQNEKAHVIALVYEEEISASFMAKKLLYERPLSILVFIGIIMSLILTYILWIFERSFNPLLNSFFSCLWLVLTTMTKTGFGDVYPVTVLGRFIVVVVCVWAVWFVTVSVVSIYVFLQPSNRQLKVMQVVWKTQAHAKLSQVAATTIQRFWKRWNGLVYNPNQKLVLVQELESTAKELRAFREARRKSTLDINDPLDLLRTEFLEYKTHLDDVGHSFEEKTKQLEATISSLTQILEKHLNSIDENIDHFEQITSELDKKYN
eukprot:c20942_g1_i1.p1 GENE.c20942_g1_i1~~c20942_g1_i1.p1  ORF type:complete len:485 (-),score=175.84 c20942_g1_i1:101-1555(-)